MVTVAVLKDQTLFKSILLWSNLKFENGKTF